MKKETTTRVLIRRTYKFNNVEVEKTTTEDLSLYQVRELRLEVAKLVDEGIAELAATLGAEEAAENAKKKAERLESLQKEKESLEVMVADFPQTEDGKFDPTQLSDAQKKQARRFRDLEGLLNETE